MRGTKYNESVIVVKEITNLDEHKEKVVIIAITYESRLTPWKAV